MPNRLQNSRIFLCILLVKKNHGKIYQSYIKWHLVPFFLLFSFCSCNDNNPPSKDEFIFSPNNSKEIFRTNNIVSSSLHLSDSSIGSLYFFQDSSYSSIKSSLTRIGSSNKFLTSHSSNFFEKLFKPGNIDSILGIRNKKLWIRLQAENNSRTKHNWLGGWNADTIRLYKYFNDTLQLVGESGNKLKLFERWYSSNGLRERIVGKEFGSPPLVLFELNSDSSQVFFWELSTGLTKTHLPLEVNNQILISEPEFSRIRRELLFWDSLILGMILSISLYHLIIFIVFLKESEGERTINFWGIGKFRKNVVLYLSFSLYGISLFFFLMNFKGYTLEKLWPNSPIWDYEYFMISAGFLSFASLAEFSRYFLDTQSHTPKLDLSLRLLVLLNLALLVFRIGFLSIAPNQYFDFNIFFEKTSIPIWTLILITSLAAALKCYRDGNRNVLNYLIANSVLILSTIIVLFFSQINNLASINDFFSIFEIGIVLQQILFALALAAFISEIRQKQLKAETKAETQESVLGQVSHEFLHPVQKIRFLAEILDSNIKKTSLPSHIKELPTKINKASDLIYYLVNYIRYAIKKEELIFETERVKIVSFFKEIIEDNRGLARSKNLNLLFKPKIENLTIQTYPVRLTIIIRNLIDNAIKYTDEGVVEIILYEKSIDRIKFLECEVTDSGIGISAMEQERVFERGFRSENINEKTGKGIGLFMAKQLIEEMNGSIFLKTSTPGNGSSFLIRFPLVVPSNIEEDKVVTKSPPEFLRKPILLIVEDDQELQELLLELLGENYEIIIANDGEEGIQKAAQIVPDLIITDIMMSRMDGIRMARRIRVTEGISTIPIIIYTAMADSELKKKVLAELKVVHFVNKGIKAEELILLINNLIFAIKEGNIASELRIESNMYHKINDKFFKQRVIPILEKNYKDSSFKVNDLYNQIILLCEEKNEIYNKAKIRNNIQKASKMTPKKLLPAYRLEQGRILLESNASLRIAEVSERVGFKDTAEFSRQFKSLYKFSPKDLRE